MQFQIKCFNERSLESCRGTVFIYDDKKKLVYQNQTNKNGILTVNLPWNIYNIVVTSKWGKICKPVLVNSHLCNTVPFLFTNHAIRPVTFILTDSHYENMPIKEGRIDLWRNT